jgi:endonuclease/exonuclease/phosphatase family metal-dependent hydrolase
MAVDSVLLSSESPPPVVILGDFNDDPFNPPLAGHLLATRDRSLAQSSSSYFYNPFWRFLGESDPHKPGIECDSICGTYLQQHGQDETRWRTFDQIIVSSGLLSSGNWQLKEQDTAIVRIPELIDAVKNKKHHFDHLPVVARIEM